MDGLARLWSPRDAVLRLRRILRHAVLRSSALHQRGRASQTPEARNASRRQAVGAELRTRHVAAAPLALLSFVSGTPAWHWVRARMARGRAAHQRRGAVYVRRRDADEPRAAGPGTDLHAAERRMLLRRWGHFHTVRTVPSAMSTALYFWLLRDLQ